MTGAVAPVGSPGRIERLVPIVGWLRTYERAWLRPDLIAGVTVAALIVPKNLGYASIAGVPLQNGLYAVAAGAILYAVFGSCRQISMGPSSGLAAVAASAVATAHLDGQAETASFVAGLTLASGLLFLVLAVLRMGWIAQFLSRAVVTGFLFGAAIDVVIGELPKLTGTDVSGSNSFQELRSWFGSLGDSHTATVLVGAVSLVVVFGIRLVAPRVPGALVLVVGGLLASYLFDLGDRGVAQVGDVPRGLPSFAIPDTSLMLDHRGPSRSPRSPWSSSGSPRRRGTPGRSRPSTAIGSTSTRNPSPRPRRTSGPVSCTACRCRPACRPARSTTTRAPGPAWPRSRPVSPCC
jgi:MFS superfamily sulfate permease-like transporter